ncbi:MAG TPA: sigma 54-interacting transcriptional regulator [Polyangia bacterium]|jgi:DNA-binding NtrC family response regulator
MRDGADGAQEPGARAPGGDLRLVVLGSEGTVELDLPATGECSVGRTGAAYVGLEDASVSRAHAVLRLGTAGVVVADLGSRNGTFVNAAPARADGILLKPGDVIRFGSVPAVLIERARQGRRAELLPGAAIDARLATEGERAVRHDRPLAALVIAPQEAAGPAPGEVAAVLTECLRSYDLLASRAAGRFEVLLPECTQDDALRIALRVDGELRERRLAARIGVAAFPATAPSVESLVPSAEAAMGTVAGAGVGVAHAAALVLHLGSGAVVVADPAMLQLYALLEQLADATAPVLVMGERGSGRSTIAGAVHAFGHRAGGPLLHVDCAAADDAGLAAQLLGAEGGADASQAATPGALERARGGTVVLREIARLPLELQAAVLGVLRTRTVCRVGGTVPRPVDVRLVVTTSGSLEAAESEGSLRADLHHLLAEFTVAVPPLRARRGEILRLARWFVQEAARETRRAPPALSPGVEATLRSYYGWPGNVAELRRVTTQAVARCEGDEIQVSHLPPEVARAWPHPDDGSGWEARSFGDTSAIAFAPPAAPLAPAAASPEVPDPGPIVIASEQPYDEAIEGLQRLLVERAMKAADGALPRAAALLQVDRRRLARMLQRLGLKG